MARKASSWRKVRHKFIPLDQLYRERVNDMIFIRNL